MKRLFVLFLLVLAFVVTTNAQTFRGSINGTVTDPSGASVPGATVKATEVETNTERTTAASSEGQFAFQDLPPGFYKLTVTASGFPTYTLDKVEVVAGQLHTVAISLKIGQSSTTVEVSAAAVALDTSSTTQTMTITDDSVQNAPLNGRDFTQLIAVQPGFGGYNVGGFGSLNGTRPNQINWQIDGVDNNDFWHNIPAVNQGGVSGIAGVVLPIDSIVEFSSQTEAGPEAGRNAGGTVNVVTRSGGNELHGSAYYYNRNEFYAAHTPFLPAGSGTPPLRNYNYGASLGGPIFKDKLFYFANFEKQRFDIGLSGIATEPSDAWVALAQDMLNNPICAPITATCTTRKYGNYAPITESAASANAIGPNGFWPRSGTSSIAALPASVDNYFAPIAETGYSYNGVARVDYNISSKHQVYLRWYGGQGSQTAPLGGSPALGTASSNLENYFEVAPIHVFNYSGVLNSTLTSKISNQLLFGANYFNQVFSDFANGFNTQSMGIYLSPDATNKGKYILGAPNIIIGPGSGTFEQIGLTPPEGRNDLTWHITDVVSQSMGAHTLRYGGEVRQAHLDEFYHRHGLGSFTFDGTQGPWSATCAGATATTGQAGCQTLAANNQLSGAEGLADFLAGDVASSTIAVGNPERLVVVNAFNLFFQDTWQATKRLNLIFGLRYEYFGPMHSQHDDLANFIPGTGFVNVTSSNPLFKPDRNNFAPRFGFAYNATQKGDLVVRGGVGMFYDQINLNPFLDFRPPSAYPAPSGIQGNPFGSSPISTYANDFCGQTSYQWDSVQVPGQICPVGTPNVGKVNTAGSIFAPVQACSDPNCADLAAQKLSAYSVSPNFRTPYFFNYNLQVEKSFANIGVWQVGYVGSEGRKLNIVSNINTPTAANPTKFPYPDFSDILQLDTIGTSNYNALQTVFRMNRWHGLTAQVGYTWSHALDEISEYRATVLDNPYNRLADYGNSDFDTRHLFTVNFTYDIPKAGWATNAWTKRLVNDWQVSSILNLHSGQPYDETLDGLNQIGNPFAGVSHSFSTSLPGGGVGVQWLNPAAFCLTSDPACGGAPVQRNKFVGPNFKDLDLSVIKNIPIKERLSLQLRADMFNVFNRINFASGVGAVGLGCTDDPVLHHCEAGFGQVNDTIGDFNGAPGLGPGEQFNMQLAAKLRW
jgi:hypothetical protein